jgi:hypothetical protein
MAVSDNRQHRIFYGIYLYDWYENFGTFSNHHYLLVDEYKNEAVSSLEMSEASVAHEFLYAHHIKKDYWIEGVVEGQITLASSACTSTVTNYRVTICKMNTDNTSTELATTGWRTVNDTLAWDVGLGVGEEMVYPFFIGVWNAKELTENDRIYIKVEVTCNSCTSLMHSNDPSWNDLKVDIPLRL